MRKWQREKRKVRRNNYFFVKYAIALTRNLHTQEGKWEGRCIEPISSFRIFFTPNRRMYFQFIPILVELLAVIMHGCN